MNPIQARTSPAELPSQTSAEFTTAAPTDTAPAGTAAADPVVQAAIHGGPDVQSRFNELFGDAGSHVLYADRRGGGHAGNATRASQADPLAGKTVPGQKDVVIARSVGDTRGYETKNHAIAWARAVGEKNAMVVQRDGRWHAVVTKTEGRTSGDAIHVGRIDPVRYDQLKQAAFAATDATKKEAAWKALASYALGIPESEIAVIGKGQQPVPNKVTINLSPDFDSEGRAAKFDPKQPPWIQLGPHAFDRPANPLSTLAHEEVHAGHRRLTAEWYQKYVDSGSTQSFRQWVSHALVGTNVDPSLKKIDVRERTRLAEIVAGYQDGTYGPTEVEAHVEAARVSLASGDLQQARTDLGKLNSMTVKAAEQTMDLQRALLKITRDALPPDARKVFDEAVAQAKSGKVLKGL